MIRIYQERPRIFKGIQYNKDDVGEVQHFVGADDVKVDNITGETTILTLDHIDNNNQPVFIWKVVENGDYIVQNADFTYRIIDKETFEKDYIEVEPA